MSLNIFMITHTRHLTIPAFIALCFVFFTLGIFPWIAQAQTESATSPSAELREIIRQRIEETIQDKKSNGPKYIGTLGTISKVSSSTFSFIDTLGRERTVELTSNTTLLIDGDSAELSDVSINAGVVIMGTALDEVLINAKRILVQEKDFSETREVFLGTITEKTNSKITVTTRGTGEALDLALLRTTTYEDLIGESITLATVQEDQSVLIITDLDKDSNRYVSRLRVLVPAESLETE